MNKNGYFSVWDKSGVGGEKHAYFVLNVVIECDLC